MEEERNVDEVYELNGENQETEEVNESEVVKDHKKKDPPRTGGGTGSLD